MNEFEVAITDVSYDGRGVARIDGKTVFVSGALQDEQVRLRIRKRHPNFDEAETLEILIPSPHRVAPRCRHFGHCGGCSLQHLDATAQIVVKQRVLADNFTRIGKVEPATWLPPLIGEAWAYRRKGRLSVRAVAKKGRVLVGFREENNPRYVADITHCDVIHPTLGTKIGLFSELIGSMEAAGDIPQIEFAAGVDTIALVFRHLKPLSEGDLTKLVAFGQEHGFAIYLQPGGVSSVHPLWPEHPRLAFHVPAGVGAEEIELTFQPLDFVQVNAGMNRRMILRMLELLDPQPEDRVLDLFCGLGNFTLPLARRVAEIAGVEGEHGLVARAADNAARHGLANACFYVANLLEDQRGSEWARTSWNKLLLDPPRAGADRVLKYLPHKETKCIVYVSCHPASLARDAGILVNRHGFRLKAAGVMDMFPQTTHVESIALFERQ